MSCDTKRKDITLRLLRRGWTTAMQSAMAGGVMSLSQRCGQWRDEYGIVDKWITTDSGARIKAYRIVKPTKWTA